MRHTSESRTADERGMTLVEIMTAAGLIAIGFLFILGGVISVSETRSTVQQQALATTVLSSVAESIGSISFDELLEFDGADIELLGGGQALALRCFAADGQVVPIPLPADVDADTLPNPLEVQAEVTWDGPRGRAMSRTISIVLRR